MSLFGLDLKKLKDSEFPIAVIGKRFHIICRKTADRVVR